MICAENLQLLFRSEPVLDNLSFRVRSLEHGCVIGPSGSGKSTIIHLLLGFVFPFAGRASVDGIEVCEKNIVAIRQRVAWLPQNLNFPFDTVRELFYTPFEFKANRRLCPSESEVQRDFEALLLDYSLMDKRLDEISGGQKQRIALIAMSFLQRPVMLLDEPTSALDLESKIAVIKYIKGLRNVTTLSATHDAEWIAAMDVVVKLK